MNDNDTSIDLAPPDPDWFGCATTFDGRWMMLADPECVAHWGVRLDEPFTGYCVQGSPAELSRLAEARRLDQVAAIVAAVDEGGLRIVIDEATRSEIVDELEEGWLTGAPFSAAVLRAALDMP